MAALTQLRRNQLHRWEKGRARGGWRASRGFSILFSFPSRNTIKQAAQTQHTGSVSCWGKSKGLQPWEREVIRPQI